MGAGDQAHVHALYLAARDPRVPWYAKAVALAVAAYAASPIDLIPDFAIRLIPGEIIAEHRQVAAAAPPVSRGGAVVIAAFWCLFLGLLGWWGYRHFYG